MSYSISTLLLRNLSDVFGENDPVRRSTAINGIFHEDAVFYDPKGGIFRGRGEIDRIAGVIKATHPDFEYQPLFPPEELGDAGRVRWVSGTPGKPPALRGNRFHRRPERSHSFGLSLFRQATRKQCERRRNDVPVRGGMREGRWQIRRHNSWDQECQADEAEAVQDEQRPQRFGAWPEADCWPDVPGSDDRPRDGVESDGNEKTAIG